MMKERRQFRSRRFEKKDEFDSKLLDLARVTRVTKGGRRLRFRAGVVVGDKKGRVGFGASKGSDVAQAIEKATRLAKKNIIKVPIFNETIPHPVDAKFGAAKVILKPQTKGRGLVAGGTARVICSLAGIKNVSSKKIGRTSNKINNAKAVIKALKELKQPKYADLSTKSEELKQSKHTDLSTKSEELKQSKHADPSAKSKE